MRLNKLGAAVLLAVLASSLCYAQECKDAEARGARALQRALRSAARAHIDLLRIRAELASIGISSSTGQFQSASPAFVSTSGSSLASQRLVIRSLRDEVQQMASAALAQMKGFYPQRYKTVVAIPFYSNAEEPTLEIQECEKAIVDIESVTFTTEQWAQLADVAAEQAIELAARRRAVEPAATTR
jgi:hypothetical protein